MADDSETKMEALKKAYAEIILNTSKEAAARVMVAERKAKCFEHDLASLKEESLHMLLRLKENFNSKLTEAEARSKNQQMKIEELEAQLGEAEEIIVDLRAELKQVQEDLEVTSQNQKKLLHGHNVGEDEPVGECELQDNAFNSSPIIVSAAADAKSVSLDSEIHPTVLNNKCCNAINSTDLSIKSHVDQLHAGNDDITSIILQNREADLYRNGCTQRIRAIERNLSDVNLSTSKAENHQSMVIVQPDINAEDADKSSQNPVTESAHITSNPSLFTDQIMDTAQHDLISRCSSHNKEKKCGKSRGELKRDCLGMLKTSGEASNLLSYCEPHMKTADNNVNSCEEPCSAFSSKSEKKIVKNIPHGLEGQLLRDCCCHEDRALRSLRRSSRKKAKYREAITTLKRPCRKSVKLLQEPFLCLCKVQRSGDKEQSVEVPIQVVQNEPKKTRVCYASESDGLRSTSAEQCDGEETRLASVDKLCSVPVHAQLIDSELVDVPISEGFDIPCRPVKSDRPLKFIFHRKRRKNVLAKVDENIVSDKVL